MSAPRHQVCIAKTYLVMTTVEFFGAVAAGKASDCVGATCVLVSAFLLHVGAVAGLVYLADTTDGMMSNATDELQWLGLFGAFALADACWQSQVYTVVGAFFPPNRLTGAFAVFAVVQHIGMAAAWGLQLVIRPDTPATFTQDLYIDAAFAALALVGFFAARAKFDRLKRDEEDALRIGHGFKPADLFSETSIRRGSFSKSCGEKAFAS